MRRACKRSARMRASVVLPTRSGPSMTIKRGGCGLRCGMRARLAAEGSVPGIFSCDPRKRRVQQADYSRVADGVPQRDVRFAVEPQAESRGPECQKIFTFVA